MRRGWLRARTCALSVMVLSVAASAGAVTQDDFRLRSGADLVALCSTPPDDPLYAAAIHMCHGYGAGAYQAIMALTGGKNLDPVICPPEPPITRNEGVRLFLEWAKHNGEHLNEAAVDVVGRFLLAQFPCRK